MVALTAVVLVLPLALAAPGGANDVNHLRGVIEDALRAGLPGAPNWVFEIALIGATLGSLWNRWAADISVMVEALRPYFGIVLEGGLSLLLGVANGVLLFVLALFIAFFFYLYGEPIAVRLREILQRIAGARAERLIDVTGATVRGVVYGILLTAIVQGILTAFGLWLSGVPRPVLLGAVAGFLRCCRLARRWCGSPPRFGLWAPATSDGVSSWRPMAWLPCRRIPSSGPGSSPEARSFRSCSPCSASWAARLPSACSAFFLDRFSWGSAIRW